MERAERTEPFLLHIHSLKQIDTEINTLKGKESDVCVCLKEICQYTYYCTVHGRVTRNKACICRDFILPFIYSEENKLLNICSVSNTVCKKGYQNI